MQTVKICLDSSTSNQQYTYLAVKLSALNNATESAQTCIADHLVSSNSFTKRDYCSFRYNMKEKMDQYRAADFFSKGIYSIPLLQCLHDLEL